jgi:hypothetical protein
MAEITYFMVVPFDYVDDGIVAGEPIGCPSPAAAIQTAQGQWKLFGHAGAVAFSRTSDFEKGKFDHRHVLRWFGQVPDDYLKADK